MTASEELVLENTPRNGGLSGISMPKTLSSHKSGDGPAFCGVRQGSWDDTRGVVAELADALHAAGRLSTRVRDAIVAGAA